ncbi:MAG TPA: hypothetical protein VKB88_22305 [Bryobacteraceae bacterium]|nr:hypothetical protein [Bryobacteraceae bacterium]
MTYQLRRLRLHGLIERIPKGAPLPPHRLWISRLRLLHPHLRQDLRPGLGLVLPATSSFPCAFGRSFDQLEQEGRAWVNEAKLAA